MDHDNDLSYGERRCPACRSKTMPKRAGKVRVDACRECQGAWFSANELQRALQEPVESVSGALQCHRLCPECDCLMNTVVVNDTKVEVDQCAECHGIWLDPGEYRGLQNHLEPEPLHLQTSQYEPTGIKKKLLMLIDNAFDSLNNWG